MWNCCSGFDYNMIETTAIEPTPDGHVADIHGLRYKEPRNKDMAIVFVIFNPSCSKRIVMNYFYALEKFKLANMPCFTIELLFHDNPPEIKDAIHIKCSSYLFHKERLCRIAEKMIPSSYKKICFMDADIVFDNPTWYERTSNLLRFYDVVQPFYIASWLNLSYKATTQERLSVIFMDKNKYYNPIFHPGFVWAFKRDWYKQNGFFDYAITGSGDTLSVAAWMNVEFKPGYLKPAYVAPYNEFRKNLKLPKITATEGKIYHLWHGNKTNRKYVLRHEILNDIPDVRNILATNSSGVFELLNRDVNAKMKLYFDEREDDL